MISMPASSHPEGSRFFSMTRSSLKSAFLKEIISRPKEFANEQPIPTGKIDGFRKYDKVEYLGKTYFIKGRMSSGYAILMDIEGNKADFSDAPRGWKTPKIRNLKRISARKSWIIDTTVTPKSH